MSSNPHQLTEGSRVSMLRHPKVVHNTFTRQQYKKLLKLKIYLFHLWLTLTWVQIPSCKNTCIPHPNGCTNIWPSMVLRLQSVWHHQDTENHSNPLNLVCQTHTSTATTSYRNGDAKNRQQRTTPNMYWLLTSQVHTNKQNIHDLNLKRQHMLALLTFEGGGRMAITYTLWVASLKSQMSHPFSTLMRHP